MYYLLAYEIAPGNTSEADVQDDIDSLFGQHKPDCVLVTDHARIYRAPNSDLEYERLVEGLLIIRADCANQLTFALARSRERYLVGDGFDQAAASAVIK